MKLILLSWVILYAATFASSQKKVVCYWGTWATYRQGYGKFNVEDIDSTLCTHLIYTFLGARSSGEVTYLDSYLDLSENYGRGYIEKFIALKSRNPSAKFLMSIGGWNMGSAVFSQIAASATSRNNFAQNVLNVINRHGFDGFDFDWEYPAQRDSTYGSADKSNFVELLKALRSKLQPNGKLLTLAVGATASSASVSYDIRNVAANVDFINLMSYDLHGSWDSTTGINSPLYAGPSDVTSYQKELNVDAIVKYWLSQGCPREKLIVGIPLYGRTFTLSNSNNYGVGASASGAGAMGSFVAESGFLGFNEICYNLNNNGWRRYWENTQKVPYAVKGNQWVGYDDLESISYKLNYIKNNNLGGAMLWSIETDDFGNICGKGKFPLVSAVHSALIGNNPTPIETTTRKPVVTTTTAPITSTRTTTSSGAFVCSNGDGLKKDPNDCSKFYNCAGGIAYHQSCPPTLLFNSIGQYCDWDFNVNC